MADTGAPWNIPYVESTDLVRDYPTDSLALANAIDAGLDAAGNAGIGSNLVQTVLAGTFTTSSTSFTPVTGLDVSITPSSATSKVLIVAVVNVSAAAANNIFFQLQRDTTDLIAPTSPGSRRSAWASVMYNFTGVGSAFLPQTVVYLDSPATTSATTYSVDVAVESATAIYINRSTDDTDNSTFARGVSTITAIEVAA